MKAKLAFLASFLGCVAIFAAPACASTTGWRLGSPWPARPSPLVPAPPSFSGPGTSSGPGTPRVYFDRGATNSVGAVTGGSTGANMSGMSVTFDYVYGGKSYSRTVPWTATAGASGGAFASNGAILNNGQIISLVESGQTDEWVLRSAGGASVENVVIEGLSGNTVFDISQTKTTPGAGAGRTATPVSIVLPGAQVNFTYSDLVMVEGSSGPVGDLYAKLEISFSGNPVSSYAFIAGAAAVSPVGAPPSLLLMSSGLLFIFIIQKRTWTWGGK